MREMGLGEHRLKWGGMVTVRELDGAEELKQRFSKRLQVVETDDEIVWIAPAALLFQSRCGPWRVIEYAFDDSKRTAKLIVEILLALISHKNRGREREENGGTGSPAGTPPVAALVWPVGPKPDEKDLPTVWHRSVKVLEA